jgi:rhodanese-related sulfurtransferase
MFSLFQRNTADSVHVNEIDSVLKEINLIDIREPYEYAHASIRTSKNIPMGELLNSPEKYLDKNKKYHIICQSGARSSRTVSALSGAGYNVVNVKGGMGSYFGKIKI